MWIITIWLFLLGCIWTTTQGVNGGEVTVFASFNSAGIRGNITFHESGGNVTISIHLDTPASPEPKNYAWGIYNYPVLFDSKTPCASQELGRSIHDLSKKHGMIIIPSAIRQQYTDTEVKLKGLDTIWGKSLLLRSIEAGDDFRSCANLVDAGEVKTVEATFTAPVAGNVIFRQSELGETTIFANVFSTSGDYTPSSNHEWKILATDILDYSKEEGRRSARRCEYLQVLYDPNNQDETDCSKELHSQCKIGDLTKKHGEIVVGAANSRYSKKFYVDTNLPLVALEGHRSLYLVLFEKSNPLRIMACTKMRSIKPKEVRTNFHSDGVKGYIIFSQRYRMDPTVVTIHLKNLRGRATTYMVHELPITPRKSKEDDECSELSVGNPYNPFNKEIIPAAAKGTTDEYEVGNLGGKFGLLDEISSMDFYFNIFADFNLPLFGAHSIVGRSIVINKRDETRWICANIGFPSVTRTAIATFVYPIVGRIIFRQEEGNYDGETTVYGQLSYGDGSVNNTENHRFGAHLEEPGRDFYNWTKRCESCGPDFNPFNVGLGRQYEKQCTPDNPLRCRLGDMSGKSRRITVASSENAVKHKFFYTDVNLPLGGANKILGKSVVVNDDHAPPHRGNRLACAAIRIYHPVRATIRAWNTGAHIQSNVTAFFSLSQDFETDPTEGRFDVNDLNEIASGYHIHELSVPQGKYFPCTEDSVLNHFNPFRVNTSLGPAPAVGSVDQYEVGDLSGKFGTLEGLDSTKITFVDNNLPLHGLHSVVGRSVVIHKKERNFRWVCGTIFPEYNQGFTREVIAIASFDDTRGYIQGYVRFRQLEYADGGMSDTWIEVDLRYPGKNTIKKTLNHPWAVYVSQVSHDAFEKTESVRCIGAGFKWNPFLMKSEDKMYDKDCRPGNPLRCEVGDLGGKHGLLDIGGPRKVVTDVNLPLVGNYSVVGRSLVIFSKDQGIYRLSCANIKLDIHLVSHVTVKKHPGFTSARFMDHMREMLNTTDWLVIEDSSAKKELVGGHCVQLKIHFYGADAHKHQLEFGNLINLGSVRRDTRLGQEVVETFYKPCKHMKEYENNNNNNNNNSAGVLEVSLTVLLVSCVVRMLQ